MANLRAAGVSVYAINPLSVARYRDRYAPSRSKSDAADALVLANIVPTDPSVHRLIPRDSELAAGIRVLARAHQDAIWDRQQTVGQIALGPAGVLPRAPGHVRGPVQPGKPAPR